MPAHRQPPAEIGILRPMVYHLVLLEPKPDLTAIEREEFLGALETALRDIPSIRRADMGTRLRHGAGYEAAAQESYEYFAVLAFDDLDGLRLYLEHPAHRALGARFNAAAARMRVYDYEDGLAGGSKDVAGSR